MERETRNQNRGGVGVRHKNRSAGESGLVLRWGNRKRLRCKKIPRKVDDGSTAVGADRALSLLRRRRSSPHRILRNSETEGGMEGPQINGVDGSSPERKGVNGGGASVVGEEDKKGGGGGGGSSSSLSSSRSEGRVWPTFVIALTNKEKEEDFMVFKGSKLPQRPKKRAKFIQRSLNLVSPGSWLCELSLERYEVREKKISKKRRRGLKAMGDLESDSE